MAIFINITPDLFKCAAPEQKKKIMVMSNIHISQINSGIIQIIIKADKKFRMKKNMLNNNHKVIEYYALFQKKTK